jgi:hypothetical protein
MMQEDEQEDVKNPAVSWLAQFKKSVSENRYGKSALTYYRLNE